MATFKAKGFLCVVISVIILSVCSCSSVSFRQKQFCDNLFSDYVAKADFSLSDSTKSIDGKIELTKGSQVKVIITEPKEYEGITVFGDNTGKSDTMTLELSGIPASIPKSIARDLSLMFTLFSDLLPSKISSLDKSHFEKESDSDIVKVTFSENGTEYSILYNSVSSLPISFDAFCGEEWVNITFTETTILQ